MSDIKYNCIVVDDDKTSLTLIANFLERRDINVFSCLTAHEALTCYKKNAIHFMFVDIGLPDINGFDLINIIHDIDSSIPISAITSNNDIKNVIAALRGGFVDYIVKPFNIDELQISLNRLMGLSKLHIDSQEQKNEIDTLKGIIDSNSAVSITDLDGKIIHVNNIFCKITGYSESELIGKTHKIIRHPLTTRYQIRDLWNTIKSGKTYKHVTRNRRKDGSTVYFDYIIAPLINAQSNIVGYFAVAYDITQKRIAEAKQKQQQLWLQDIINFSPNILILTNGKQIRYVNRAFLSFFGFESTEEFLKIGKDIFEYFIKQENMLVPRRDWLEQVNECIKNDISPRICMQNHLSGKLEIFSVSLSHIRVSDLMIISFTNITYIEEERASLQQQVKETVWELIENQAAFSSHMTRFEFALNSTGDGFYDYDIGNDNFYISPGWKNRLGFVSEENHYNEFFDLINQKEFCNEMKDFKHIINLAFMARKDKKVGSFRLRYNITTLKNENIVVEDRGVVLFNDEEHAFRIVGFLRDITEQSYKDDILSSQGRLAALGEMIANIAHQWRQPLSAINNILNDLEFEIELDDLHNIDIARVMAISNDIRSYTNYLSNTIDDFRNFGKIDKNKENFAVTDPINEAYHIVSHSYKSNMITLKQNFEGFSDKVLINGPKRELSQVLLNILNNAKDAILEKKPEKPEVVIRVFEKEISIVIEIADNAGGIPINVIEKIFDPYFTTKHESIGTGIGLYTSKLIVDGHFNGELTAYNSKVGAVFRIEIPRNIS